MELWKFPDNYKTAMSCTHFRRTRRVFSAQLYEGQEVFGNCQDGLPRSRSRLTIKAAFHKGMTDLENERRAEVIFLLDFTESFSADFHSIFVAKIEKCGHDHWTMGLEDHWPQSTVKIKLRAGYKCHSSRCNTGVSTDQCLH